MFSQAPHLLVTLVVAVTACRGDSTFTLELQTGRQPAKVTYGDQVYSVPVKSRYVTRGRVGTPITIEVGKETVTWAIPARAGETFAVPVSNRQCFASSDGLLQTTAAPVRVAGPVRQVACGTKITPEEVAMLPRGVTYDDVIAIDAGKAAPEPEDTKHRAQATALAEATGYAVATSSSSRALLYRGRIAVAVDLPLMGAAFTADELAAWKTRLADPSKAQKGTLATTEHLTIGLTYSSIAAEFPGIYANTTQREIPVANAGSYGNVLVLYSLGLGPYLSRSEVDALETVGIDLAAAAEAQVAAASEAVARCARAATTKEVECAETRAESEAVVRFLALLAQPATTLVARIVNDPDRSGAALVLSPADSAPPSDPDGTLPYTLVVDAGSVRAR